MKQIKLCHQSIFDNMPKYNMLVKPRLKFLKYLLTKLKNKLKNTVLKSSDKSASRPHEKVVGRLKIIKKIKKNKIIRNERLKINQNSSVKINKKGNNLLKIVDIEFPLGMRKLEVVSNILRRLKKNKFNQKDLQEL